jgi:hypothetical protein
VSGEGQGEKLSLKDYLALFIAMLQTVALPMVILVLILLAALVVLRLAS